MEGGILTIRLIFNWVRKIQEVVDNVRENRQASRRLGERFAALLPALTLLKRNESKLRQKSCAQLLQVLLKLTQDAYAFMANFTNKAYFVKVWNHNTDKEAFSDFNSRLSRIVTDLQLGYTVDLLEQNREDIEDARNDIGQGFEVVEHELHAVGCLTEDIRQQIHLVRDEQIRMAQNIPNAVEDAFAGAVKREMHLAVRLLRAQEKQPMKTLNLRHLQYSEQESRVLGSGSFGTVYVGTYNAEPVAVKVVRLTVDDSRESMENEVQIHELLESPNIIRFYGANFYPNRCILVTELCLGSLHDYLYSTSKLNLEKSPYMKLCLLADVASGMDFIHSVGILHRDLKPANCLISSAGRAKVTDFGLSKIRSGSTNGPQSSIDRKGTYSYMAPEIFEDPPIYSRKGDVYSFAILANEVMCEEIPYKNLSDVQIFRKKIAAQPETPALFPNLDIGSGDVSSTLDELQGLVSQAWAKDITSRPPFASIAPAVRRMARQLNTPAHVTVIEEPQETFLGEVPREMICAVPSQEKMLVSAPRILPIMSTTSHLSAFERTHLCGRVGLDCALI